MRVAGLLCLLALLLTPPPTARAEAAGPVRMGGDPRYPPHHFLDERGQPAGFDVELLRAIAADRGLELRFQFGEWNGVLDRLERGELDVVPMFISGDRRQRFLFTRPFDYRHHRLYARSDAPPVAGVADLAGRRVAVQFGGLAWEWLNTGRTGARLMPVNVEEGAVLAVARGEADLALVPADIGERAVARHRLRHIAAVGPPMLVMEYAFGVNPRRPDLVAELNAGLSRLEGSDRLLEMRMRWQDSSAATHARRWPWWLAGAAVLALMSLVLWRWRRGRRYPMAASP
ncbi:transporter substrate-binding domain-containing protein [Arenimonas fontis]|nr:transporter substrate-binding domain-containing protein [Arenimonas fontis]